MWPHSCDSGALAVRGAPAAVASVLCAIAPQAFSAGQRIKCRKGERAQAGVEARPGLSRKGGRRDSGGGEGGSGEEEEPAGSDPRRFFFFFFRSGGLFLLQGAAIAAGGPHAHGGRQGEPEGREKEREGERRLAGMKEAKKGFCALFLFDAKKKIIGVCCER